MIQHPYNVRIIEPPYYKAYLGYISAQKAPRCLSAAYLKWQTCCSNCYLHTNRVDVFKPFGRMDKGSVIPPAPTHPPTHAYCLCQGLSAGDSWVLEDDWWNAGAGKFASEHRRGGNLDHVVVWGLSKQDLKLIQQKKEKSSHDKSHTCKYGWAGMTLW